MPQNGMTIVIKTPNGEMEESSATRRVVASLTDLFVLLAAAGVVGIFVQTALSYVFGYWSPSIPLVVLCIAVLGYLLVPRIYSLRTPGQWALGLRCFRFNELADFSGKGNLWCVENHPPREYTKRTFVVVGFLASFYVISWLYNG